MEQKQACVNCRSTDKAINSFSFWNLLGQEFAVFVCKECIQSFAEPIFKLAPAQQVTYLTKLGQTVSRKY